jgi:hypothetical protein
LAGVPKSKEGGGGGGRRKEGGRKEEERRKEGGSREQGAGSREEGGTYFGKLLRANFLAWERRDTFFRCPSSLPNFLSCSSSGVVSLGLWKEREQERPLLVDKVTLRERRERVGSYSRVPSFWGC